MGVKKLWLRQVVAETGFLRESVGNNEVSRRKKEEKFSYLGEREEGRRKNAYTANFLPIGILCLIRWIYLFSSKNPVSLVGCVSPDSILFR